VPFLILIIFYPNNTLPDVPAGEAREMVCLNRRNPMLALPGKICRCIVCWNARTDGVGECVICHGAGTSSGRVN